MFANIALSVLKPIQYSRRGCNAAAEDDFGDHFRLHDWRNRSRLVWHVRASPIELRRINRWQFNHRQSHCAARVHQFRTQGNP